MRAVAVVVYESMYGNTHLVADAIGAGLRPAFDVTVVPVTQAGPAILDGADLIVVGGPTHVHGMSRASKRVDRLLRAHGFDVVIEPESFLVTKQNQLMAHESARAREWGTKLAGLAPKCEPSTQG